METVTYVLDWANIILFSKVEPLPLHTVWLGIKMIHILFQSDSPIFSGASRWLNICGFFQKIRYKYKYL